MPSYSYAARDIEGQLIEATLEAASRYDALTILRHRGLTATNLVEDGRKALDDARPSEKDRAPARRKRRDKAGGRHKNRRKEES